MPPSKIRNDDSSTSSDSPPPSMGQPRLNCVRSSTDGNISDITSDHSYSTEGCEGGMKLSFTFEASERVFYSLIYAIKKEFFSAKIAVHLQSFADS
jgi:hypothetical protein